MRNYYEEAKQEFKNRYDKYINERDKCLENAYIIDENRFENRSTPFIGGTFLFGIILSIITAALTGNYLLAFTEGVNYLLPIFGGALVNLFPATIIGLSFIGGKAISMLNEKFTHIREKFKYISFAKTEKQKVEDLLDCEIQAQKDTYRFKIMTEAIDTLCKHHEEFEDLDKKYDANNNSTPQTYEDTINNIENLEKELEEKYKELDVIATKKVLHDRFYKLRFFGNRFDKRFTNTMLWFLIIFMSVNMPYMCVGEALPFNSTIKLLHLLVSLFGGLIGTSAYFIKKDRDMLKVFNNRNNLLGKDKFSKKPSKNEIEELCKIYKDYDKITLAIRNLEIKLQEQKAIKTVIEHNNQDKYYLNKNYSHANIPLMEFTSDDSSKTNDEDAPKMIVKK